MKQVSWILALVIGAAIGFLGRGALDGGGGDAGRPIARRMEDPRAVYRVPLEDSAAKGPAGALVTIVEFSDFQCPFCKRGEATMKELEAAYPGKLRFVFKEMPLPMHPAALPAALAAEAAREQGGDAAFWALHDKLFELAPNLDAAAIEQAAQGLGLDVAKLRESIAAKRGAPRIERDQKLATSLGATGTPAFFINGRKLVGAQPTERFRALIDEELRKAERVVGGGVPAAEVYARLTDRGATAPVWISGSAPAPIRPAPPPTVPQLRPPAPAPGAPAPTAPQAPTAQRYPPPAPEYHSVPVRADDPVRGAKDAKLTVVLFSDFQCPYCGNVEPSVKKLLETYPGQIRVVWKHQPLAMHQHAFPAAVASEAARVQGKFWELHDRFFENQGALSPEQIQQTAASLGLNMARFQADAASPAAAARVAEDQKLGTSAGASGTPTLFFNCRKVVGAYPFDTLKQVADEELAKADAVLKGARVGPGTYEKVCDAGVKSAAASAGRLPAALTIRPDDPAKGKVGAPVTLVVFSDFQCPFCAALEPTLAQVVRTYGDRVRLVWKHQPLGMHPNALPAALAAEAAREQGRFWEMHDKLFANQRALSDASYDQFARELGLDLARFEASRAAARTRARVAEDQAIARSVGADGTPTLYVNGTKIPGAASYEQLRAAIDLQLAAAR